MGRLLNRISSAMTSSAIATPTRMPQIRLSGFVLASLRRVPN